MCTRSSSWRRSLYIMVFVSHLSHAGPLPWNILLPFVWPSNTSSSFKTWFKEYLPQWPMSNVYWDQTTGKHEVPTQHIQKCWIRPCTSLLKYPMSTIIKTHPDLNHIDKMLSNKIGKDFLSTKVIEIKEKKNKYTKKLETSVVCKRTWKFCIGQKIGILKK